MEYQNNPRCNATGKEIFERRADARVALGRYANAKGCRKIYRCPFGDHYHLTKGERGKPRGAK